MADCNRNCCNDCGRERKYPCDTNFREAVCVHTDKIYDSCRDKDCLENVRVYLTSCGQDIVDRAINVKCCLLYTSPSPRDGLLSRMPSSA